MKIEASLRDDRRDDGFEAPVPSPVFGWMFCLLSGHTAEAICDPWMQDTSVLTLTLGSEISRRLEQLVLVHFSQELYRRSLSIRRVLGTHCFWRDSPGWRPPTPRRS